MVFLVYIHHAVTVMMPTAEMMVGNGIQIVLFFIAGAFIGTYSDMRISYGRAISGGNLYSPAVFPAEQKLLVYLDDSGASINAVRYIAHLFKGAPDIRVTPLKVVNTPEAEPSSSNTTRENGNFPAHISSSYEVATLARSLLLESGFQSTSIESKLVDRKNARVSDVLLAEQESGGHSAIVVGRHRLTRSEEFLFGSVAIRLVRQANCPVWVIGDSSSPERVPDTVPAESAPES
ncbi:MAG: universal stress protein [Candidatus Abyssobacteria bacterium SURF_5]|uniref:Universal stress protein n=1 Tax=Abyssobacteria bacterium (strain SURF_5) TaxID=2093360 RepID=A0A3A4N228_ABYX5|nr:MAG: universal stress protein [Candidatus Abyssubacteria bacterium SURF_5]